MQKYYSTEITEITKILKNLNSVAFGWYYFDQHNINNEYLTTIFKNCKNLKCLDIYDSNVTEFRKKMVLN